MAYISNLVVLKLQISIYLDYNEQRSEKMSEIVRRRKREEFLEEKELGSHSQIVILI